MRASPGRFFIYSSVVFFLAGLGALVSSVAIYRGLQDAFSRDERYFILPVHAPAPFLRLRNDAYGKGFFGSSRNGGRRHKGIDITAPVGGPVFAAKSGRVSVSREEKKGYGQYIEIYHPDGLRTRYAHLARRFVTAGDWVRRGDVIGECGKTGNAYNPRMTAHLHFEIRTAEGAVNPTSGLMTPSVKILNQ